MMEKLLKEFKDTSFELCMLCETMERVSVVNRENILRGQEAVRG